MRLASGVGRRHCARRQLCGLGQAPVRQAPQAREQRGAGVELQRLQDEARLRERETRCTDVSRGEKEASPAREEATKRELPAPAHVVSRRLGEGAVPQLLPVRVVAHGDDVDRRGDNARHLRRAVTTDERGFRRTREIISAGAWRQSDSALICSSNALRASRPPEKRARTSALSMTRAQWRPPAAAVAARSRSDAPKASEPSSVALRARAKGSPAPAAREAKGETGVQGRVGLEQA